jgi:DMSO/TMAO reductase YedYZ molybdopterin-dependent catalytic subunit
MAEILLLSGPDHQALGQGSPAMPFSILTAAPAILFTRGARWTEQEENAHMRILSALLLVANTASVTAPDVLVIKGDIEHELHLTAAAVHELPHVETAATDGHSGQTITFRGVWLSDLLARAGVPLGEKLRGMALATYVVAEASDGYRVVFSLAEVDPRTSGSDVLIADAADGKPLDEKTGPLRLVVPRDKRPARWVRQLTTLRIVKLP